MWTTVQTQLIMPNHNTFILLSGLYLYISPNHKPQKKEKTMRYTYRAVMATSQCHLHALHIQRNAKVI